MTGDTQALRDLLVRERTCLRDGLYDSLAEIALQKERYVQALRNRPPADVDMAELKRMMTRNAGLIAAARAGFEAARQDLATLRHTANCFNSYDADGRSAEIAAASRPSVERRA